MPDPRVAILITAKDLASKAFAGVGKAGSSAGRLIADNWKTIAVGAGAAGAALEVMGQKVRAQNEQIAKAALITGQTSKALRELIVESSNVTRPMEDVIAMFKIAGQTGLKTGKDLKAFAAFWDTVGDAAGENAVELAKAGKALKGLGVETGKESKATKALGFILTKTTISVKEFLKFADRAGAELREMGLDVNDTAAILGVLTNELGMSARVANSEFTKAVIESKGNLEEMYDILGITADQVEDYTDKVEDSGDAVQQLADIHEDSYTVMQKVHHWISELVLANGEFIQKATDLAPLLIGVATALTAIVTIAPAVKAGQAFINAGFVRMAATSNAAALGITAVKTSLAVVAAFFAGWKIGTILADRFVIVQKAGIAMALGMIKVWNWIKGAGVFAAKVLKTAWAKTMNFIKDALVALLDKAAIAADHLYAVGLASEDMANNMRKMSGEIQKAKTHTDSFSQSWEQFTTKVRDANKAVDEIGAEMFVQADLRKKATDVIEDETEAIEENTDATNENLKLKKKSNEEDKKKAKKKKEEKIELPMRFEQFDVIPAKLEIIDEALRRSGEGNILFGETMAHAVDLSVEKLEEMDAAVAEKAKRIEEFMMVAARGTFTAFEDMWTVLIEGQDGFHKAFLSGMRDMMAQVIQMYVMQIVATKIKDIAIAIAEGSFTFGASLAYIPAILAASAAGIAGLKAIKFAEGGIVTQATLGLVGEAGPEAIIPLSKMGMMGGAVYNQTLVGPFIATPTEAREWARQLIRYFEEEQAR